MDVARRLVIARARDREQVRNRVIANNPGLDAAGVEQLVEQVYFQRRSDGGRKSAARTAARTAAAREILAVHAELIADVEHVLAKLRTLADAGDLS
jgi:hypothetical protein